MAANFGKIINAKKLILTHFGGWTERSEEEEHLKIVFFKIFIYKFFER